ncbi:Ig-like domain-containing protein [Hymenobacter coccineus]|uniref:Ig-like domain-containing protein n=1 Tax=Hymenobacter coccineus TaxID=1908235 RepID=UPI001300EFB8|nr:Ig-like domain-containing protein [Hymenobacter coccineus]
MLAAYEQSRPVVTRFWPAPDANGLLDASVREIRVEFSVPMDPGGHSTDYGSGGKAAFPVVKQPGFGSDKRIYTYQVALQPGHPYSFVLNGGGFQDANGYPLKPYEVKFRTRE